MKDLEDLQGQLEEEGGMKTAQVFNLHTTVHVHVVHFITRGD